MQLSAERPISLNALSGAEQGKHVFGLHFALAQVDEFHRRTR